MRPMLGREVVKGKQDFFIFLQAFAGFWEFGLVTGDSLHLLLAHQARPLYSLALVHPFFLASSSEAALFLFLTERVRLSLSPHPQNSVIALCCTHVVLT